MDLHFVVMVIFRAPLALIPLTVPCVYLRTRIPEGFSQYSRSTLNSQSSLCAKEKKVSFHALSPSPEIDCHCLLFGACWPGGGEREGEVLYCPSLVLILGRSSPPPLLVPTTITV